ncbi:MAG TPA: TraR/DksA C4-type zinc finger protein [Anaerolineae bacterium]|nr:TraR/DksA C4-type zinc finger protein [Anaerolineae bacterium]
MLNELNLQTISEKLNSDLIQIEQELNGGQPHTGQSADTNLDRDDLASAFTSRERREALRSMKEEQAKKIKQALHHIDNGTYGVCHQCQSPIRSGRLEIIPYATLCINCQAKQDKLN